MAKRVKVAPKATVKKTTATGGYKGREARVTTTAKTGVAKTVKPVVTKVGYVKG